MPSTNHTLVATALLLAVTAGCWGRSFHQQAGLKAEDFFDDPQVIALCQAIQAGSLRDVQSAVEVGADVNAIGTSGMTPLMWAYPDHKTEIFRWLLEQGADPNVCLTGDIGYLFTKGTSVTYLAIKTKWTDYYPLVLKHGGNPDLKCEGQREPLICVPTSTLVPETNERIEALLDAGADINAKSSSDTTLVMGAVAVARFQLALMLLERGADINSYQERHNRQLVHFVIGKQETLSRYSESNEKAYWRIVDFLKERGVDFDKAREDIKRWKSWRGKPLAVPARLRKLEQKERNAREAEQQPQPELAEPDGREH